MNNLKVDNTQNTEEKHILFVACTTKVQTVFTDEISSKRHAEATQLLNGVLMYIW